MHKWLISKRMILAFGRCDRYPEEEVNRLCGTRSKFLYSTFLAHKEVPIYDLLYIVGSLNRKLIDRIQYTLCTNYKGICYIEECLHDDAKACNMLPYEYALAIRKVAVRVAKEWEKEQKEEEKACKSE